MKPRTLCSAALLMVGITSGSTAEPLPMVAGSQSIIGENAMASVHGAVGVNVAAGNNNMQLNALSIGMGKSGEATIVAYQGGRKSDVGATGDLGVRLESHAFANAAGVVGINQSSGEGNAQINAVAFTSGDGLVVTEQELADAVTTATDEIASPRGAREASIATTAFSNAKGVAQVNQMAGVGNAGRNVFVTHGLIGGK